MLSARSTARFMGTLAAVTLLCAPQAWASNVLFSLDPDASSISIAGTVTLDPGTGPVTLPFSSQDPPANTSVTTSYSGSIVLDVDDPLAPTSLAFVGSSAVAAISGDWLPEAGGGTIGDAGAPAPANYALALSLGQLGTAVAAVRELEFDIVSLPLAVTGGSFSSMQGFGIAGGVFDFNVPPALDGGDADSTSLVGGLVPNAAADGSYSCFRIDRDVDNSRRVHDSWRR